MDIDPPVIAGVISTTIFALSYFPMLTKAYRTKDLRSYSLGNILLANTGNVVHSVYVYNLPAGPIWFLHTFYLVTTAMMLFWYFRYELRPKDVWTRFVGMLTTFAPASAVGMSMEWPDYQFLAIPDPEDRAADVEPDHGTKQLDQRPSVAA